MAENIWGFTGVSSPRNICIYVELFILGPYCTSITIVLLTDDIHRFFSVEASFGNHVPSTSQHNHC